MVMRYEDLDVYKRSYAVALNVHKLSLEFPKIEQFALSSQIRRSSKSICANIAEGFAKQHASVPEFKRFLDIAIGSCEETRVWLTFAKDLDYISIQEYSYIHDEYDQITKMLHGLRKNWQHERPKKSNTLLSHTLEHGATA